MSNIYTFNFIYNFKIKCEIVKTFLTLIFIIFTHLLYLRYKVIPFSLGDHRHNIFLQWHSLFKLPPMKRLNCLIQHQFIHSTQSNEVISSALTAGKPITNNSKSSEKHYLLWLQSTTQELQIQFGLFSKEDLENLKHPL